MADPDRAPVALKRRTGGDPLKDLRPFRREQDSAVESRTQPLAAMSASTAAMVRTGTPVPPFEV
ncbi:hypothetical protein DFR72_115268 [Lentzea flaviverrucosa]|uniref:Uncharacterized protein n=1 Tax=Lentzea flaviverrucosa TaxID=200379 RepID=A0A1H9XLT6_9PSEU|nr:hypothetical protein DFR72_115268 [Lentzea flaviverrucosa]SES47074.1 hypothetical protein SAMN05216195_115268 [Lentzea flaviverrucosa]